MQVGETEQPCPWSYTGLTDLIDELLLKFLSAIPEKRIQQIGLGWKIMTHRALGQAGSPGDRFLRRRQQSLRGCQFKGGLEYRLQGSPALWRAGAIPEPGSNYCLGFLRHVVDFPLPLDRLCGFGLPASALLTAINLNHVSALFCEWKYHRLTGAFCDGNMTAAALDACKQAAAASHWSLRHNLSTRRGVSLFPGSHFLCRRVKQPGKIALAYRLAGLGRQRIPQRLVLVEYSE